MAKELLLFSENLHDMIEEELGKWLALLQPVLFAILGHLHFSCLFGIAFAGLQYVRQLTEKEERVLKIVKGESGFTLIEMMIVLLIISVLVLIAIPNVTKHSKSIDEKGCKAYVKMVEGQVAAYKMEHHKNPSLEELIDDRLFA